MGITSLSATMNVSQNVNREAIAVLVLSRPMNGVWSTTETVAVSLSGLGSLQSTAKSGRRVRAASLMEMYCLSF